MTSRGVGTIGWVVAGWLLLAPGTAAAQRAPSAAETGIWIADASGELRRVLPSATFLRGSRGDAAVSSVSVVLAVETFAETASGALAAGELTLSRVMRAVAGFGASAAEVTREAPIVRPRFERRLLAGSWEKPRVLGYDAAHVVTVRASSPRNVGLLIDLAVGAGATRVLDVVTETPPP